MFVALGIQHSVDKRRIIVCGLSGSTVFCTLSHKFRDCCIKLLKKKYISIFSTTLSELFLIMKRNERDMIIKVRRSYCQLPIFFQILMKLVFSWQIFQKYPNIIFQENPSSGCRVVPRGRTDRREEANSRFFSISRKRL